MSLKHTKSCVEDGQRRPYQSKCQSGTSLKRKRSSSMSDLQNCERGKVKKVKKTHNFLIKMFRSSEEDLEEKFGNDFFIEYEMDQIHDRFVEEKASGINDVIGKSDENWNKVISYNYSDIVRRIKGLSLATNKDTNENKE